MTSRVIVNRRNSSEITKDGVWHDFTHKHTPLACCTLKDNSISTSIDVALPRRT